MFSRGDNSPKRFNLIGEDEGLMQKKQKKQTKVKKISQLMLKLVNYKVTRQDIERM